MFFFDKWSAARHLCVFVFAVVPFERAQSSLSIPVNVKSANTRRENMIINTSSSVNTDAINVRLVPQLCDDSQLFAFFTAKVTAAHTESELKLSSYLRCVTWASRCWPSHSSFMIHDTHTLSHFICPSLSLCHTLARTVKSWLTRAISSLSEIKLTLIINGPCCCVC